MRPLQQWWAEQSRNTRLALGAAVAVVVVGGVIATALTLSGGSDQPKVGAIGVSIDTAQASGTAGGTGSADAVATVPPIDDTPENLAALRIQPGLPTLDNLADLTNKYGPPPDANLGHFRIPTLGVDAPLGGRRVGDDGYMKGPAGPSDVVWYDFANWKNLGGLPGTGSNAVFSGHVDYAARIPYANVNYRGKGVFYSIGLLSPGDQVELDWGGRIYKYAVVWRRTMPATGTNWNDVFARKVPEGDVLTFITCAGVFDKNAIEYSDRLVVRAVRI